MDEIKAKQQVVEMIKEASKILVTVSNNPSVDALSAALGLAIILDKQEKYATAIFSGQTPPAIAFLEPEKTFDDTTDSLRDFIIALNKEKADHLRYKVEGDSVKIFITPYKTTINEDDLIFSQGDYNVELVIALGVDNQEHLDAALENHGQILHDAAIITMTADDQTSTLGGVDWHDSESSSLSEMVAGLAEAMKDDKKKSLLDATIATALLTGIVAETDRFSNERTTSKVMSVAASLMAAGADQQLIATELQKSHTINEDAPEKKDDSKDSSDSGSNDGTISIKQDSLDIEHDDETLAELDRRVRGEEKSQEKIEEELEAITHEAEGHAEKREEQAIADATPHPIYGLPGDEPEEKVEEPTFGSALSATAEDAADDARRDAESDQNRTILSHSYIEPAATTEGGDFPGAPAVAPGSQSVSSLGSEAPQSVYAFDQPAPVSEPAFAPTPTDLGLPLPPPLPDFSQVAVPPPAIPLPPTPEQPAILGDSLTTEPAPAAPSLPDFSSVQTPVDAVPNSAYAFEPEAPAVTLPPAPEVFSQPVPEAPIAPPPVAPTPPTPGQFQIPGQPQ